jgi:hypothetical protein
MMAIFNFEDFTRECVCVDEGMPASCVLGSQTSCCSHVECQARRHTCPGQDLRESETDNKALAVYCVAQIVNLVWSTYQI